MEYMRLPVPHFHHVVAAALILTAGGAGLSHAEPEIRPNVPQFRIQIQDETQQGESGAEAADAASAPAEAPELTAEARLREREDLDLLFAELAQPEGESWARAETDILRIWSRSGSAAMDLLYKRGEAALDAGDTAGAMRASGTAKTWAIVASVLAVLGIIINIWFYMNGGMQSYLEAMQAAQG